MRLRSQITKEIKSNINWIRFKPKPVLFDHIPKCAGTTITNFLTQYYPRRLRYDTSTDSSKVSFFMNMPLNKRRKVHLVTGHFAYLLHSTMVNQPIRVIVFREPIDRVVSHYYYVKRNKDHYLYERTFGSKKVTLLDYCSVIDVDEIRNYLTRRYSNMNFNDIIENPELAVNNAYEYITSTYDIIGFQDNIESLISRLAHSMGIPASHVRFNTENQTTNRKPTKVLDSATIAAISEANAMDIRLFQKLIGNYV